MADHTHIEWTDATWNPITGCSVISPGCTNCYAMRLAGGRLRGHPSRAGLTQPSKAGPVWTDEVRLNEAWLDQPLGWSRPRRIFVGAHTDLFHENVPDAWLDQVFARMAITRRHTFQVLTKRAARMRAYCSEPQTARRIWALATDTRGLLSAQGAQWDGGEPWPLPNVWKGVSVEDQPRADERIPEILATPAAVRFLSAEPLIAPLNLDRLHGSRDLPGGGDEHWWESCLSGKRFDIWAEEDVPAPKLDWVIVGGEHGPRPMHPDWARKIRDDCAEAGVAFFFKQWGSFAEFEAGEPNRELFTDSSEADAILADYGKRCAWVHRDGRVYRTVYDLPEGEPCRLMIKVGKKAAGRVLDGATWSQMPEPRS